VFVFVAIVVVAAVRGHGDRDAMELLDMCVLEVGNTLIGRFVTVNIIF
jgi:hypothetical protein